uniref:LRRNT domain-containing protein n=1 Tax=Pseudonaja textilis TaxID=8673 RepID=A0A670YJJ5_PSETE
KPSGSSLTIFLFLPHVPTSGCPDVCSCSLGKVNCVDRGLRLVPLQLPTNATALLLEHNLITTLQNGSFVAQKVLRHLSLRNNVLTSIHRLALVGLHELQDLDLSNNSLSLLHPDTFLPVPTLRTLMLGHNRLLSLGPELPRALPHLRALFVHRNALSDLPAGFFESLPSLSSLTLEGNPWICSCGLWSLFLWLTKNRDKVPGKQPASTRLQENSPPRFPADRSFFIWNHRIPSPAPFSGGGGERERLLASCKESSRSSRSLSFSPPNSTRNESLPAQPLGAGGLAESQRLISGGVWGRDRKIFAAFPACSQKQKIEVKRSS